MPDLTLSNCYEDGCPLQPNIYQEAGLVDGKRTFVRKMGRTGYRLDHATGMGSIYNVEKGRLVPKD